MAARAEVAVQQDVSGYNEMQAVIVKGFEVSLSNYLLELECENVLIIQRS